jgi:hypothetical protein
LELLLFAPLVRFEDMNRTERFLMDTWAADPLVPLGAGELPLPGINGLNDSAGGAFYKDTTKVDWDAQYEIVTPIVQMLFDRDLSTVFLGRDFHSSSRFGPDAEDMVRDYR